MTGGDDTEGTMGLDEFYEADKYRVKAVNKEGESDPIETEDSKQKQQTFSAVVN